MTDWASNYFERGYLQRWALGPPSEDTRQEVDALWDRLRLTADAPLLDVGCGHGRHALALAQRGASVTGLDFAAPLLTPARELSAAHEVSVSWIRGDMRALPLRERSIRACKLFDAFGVFDADEENLRVLREVARVLVPGGRLAVKVVNAEPIMSGFRAADREDRAGTLVEIERALLTDPPRLVEDLAVRGPPGRGPLPAAAAALPGGGDDRGHGGSGLGGRQRRGWRHRGRVSPRNVRDHVGHR